MYFDDNIKMNTSDILTYLLTPWCRVLLEKLIGLQLIKKFPTFHRTRRFITALTSVRQLSLSWTSPIQFIYPHTTSWRSILILSIHLRLGLPSGSFPPVSPRCENAIWTELPECEDCNACDECSVLMKQCLHQLLEFRLRSPCCLSGL